MAKLEMNYDEYIPLRDIVFKTLRDAIITGEFQPGERLMEMKLANEMGVSRTPVREAIKKLEAEGLVIMNPRRGAQVAPINEKDLKDILEIRKALESLSCRIACGKVNPDDIKHLRSINRAVAKAVRENDIPEIVERDVEFHDAINLITDNARLAKFLGQLKEHLYRYRLEFIKNMENCNTIIEDHERIIEAIAQKNADVACKEIEDHIELQERFILNTLEEEK